jgi:hypothetical protein
MKEYSDRPLPVSAPERNNKGPVVAIAAQPGSTIASREASELFGVAPDWGREIVCLREGRLRQVARGHFATRASMKSLK